MKIFKYVIISVMVCMMAGCTITSRLHRRGSNALIEHSTRKMREDIVRRQEELASERKGYIEYTRVDSTKVFLVPAHTNEHGETMMTLEIPEVTVMAQSRSLPERGGKVDIDFVIHLPKELMGNCRGVDVTPVLHKTDEMMPLQDLTIRGALFNKVQERNYWQYGRYLDLFRPDEEGRQWAYERFIYYPYPEGTRLDSVITNRTTISYFYKQEVPTTEAGNKLLITLQGRVAALDHSHYYFPLSDTLEYNISSMLSFVDTTTRYMTRIIEKYAVVKDRNYLTFKVNKSDIIDTLGDNRAQLGRIEGLMDQLVNQNEFHLDSIILTASASPEGSIRKNTNLSKDRAHALRTHLMRKFPKSRMDTLITVRWIGEDWTELASLLQGDVKVKNRTAILKMIADNGSKDKDALEKEIKRRYPQDYKYMLNVLYPRLRAVSFKYDLRRVGMVKDTIHTTVPDTLYARGIKLLTGRKYAEALQILNGFYDRNTAVCLLSLGQDQRAYDVLKELPLHSTHEYLKAVACARLGRRDEALEHFDKAVELNESMKYRGKLDPEIAEIIKDRDDETP